MIQLLLLVGLVVGAAAPTTPSAEPIYWRQNVFFIPYQWASTTGAGAAQTVRLYVSKDRGATWQQISEARPELRAFTYRAEADGEYWFAIRTSDARGGLWPAGPMQPELHVVVDTTIPRIESLTGVRRDNVLEIRWNASDVNLDPNTWKFESQTEAAGPWQSVSLPNMPAASNGVSEGQASVQLAAGEGPVSLRATVYDRAGNRAVFQCSVQTAAVDDAAASGWPALISGRGDGDNSAADDSSTDATDTEGWVSNSASTNVEHKRPSQIWPADRSVQSFFQFAWSAGGTVENTFSRDTLHGVAATTDLAIPDPTADDRPLGDVPPQRSEPFAALSRFREVSVARAGQAPRLNEESAHISIPMATDVVRRMVNARSFDLEYELHEVGSQGVSRVELWGTRDGGQSWRNYAVDSDNRSPLPVTVDGEGWYGFRIVVIGSSGTGGFPPHPGEAPEFWVGVDLHRPRAKLTGTEIGSGDFADHLIVRWQVEDDNLESRPIALYYSSRAAGPWTAIATSLENSGEYAWRLERHIPQEIYLRLEARDTVGNVATFQTTEAIDVDRNLPVARVRRLPAIDGPVQ